MVLDFLCELEAALPQLANCLFDIIAIKRHVRRAGREAVPLRRVNAQVGLRRVKDQPAVANIGRLPAELVAKKRP